MRLIDAVVVEERLWDARRAYQLMDNSQDADKIMHGIYNAEQIIREASTVDAVPVVRCRECKWWRGPIYGNRCSYHFGPTHTEFYDADEFCSRGERKGGDNP